MLTTATIVAALADFEFAMFGLDWTFEAYETPYEGQWLRIRVTVPDSRRPGEDQPLDIHTAIPPYDTVDAFVMWLVYRLCRIATHEVREAAKFRGRLVSDPHRVETYATRAVHLVA